MLKVKHHKCSAFSYVLQLQAELVSFVFVLQVFLSSSTHLGCSAFVSHFLLTIWFDNEKKIERFYKEAMSKL